MSKARKPKLVHTNLTPFDPAKTIDGLSFRSAAFNVLVKAMREVVKMVDDKDAEIVKLHAKSADASEPKPATRRHGRQARATRSKS